MQVDNNREIHLGEHSRLSPALRQAKVECLHRGVAKWDWIVDTYSDGERISTRSSIGGFEH